MGLMMDIQERGDLLTFEEIMRKAAPGRIPLFQYFKLKHGIQCVLQTPNIFRPLNKVEKMFTTKGKAKELLAKMYSCLQENGK